MQPQIYISQAGSSDFCEMCWCSKEQEYLAVLVLHKKQLAGDIWKENLVNVDV